MLMALYRFLIIKCGGVRGCSIYQSGGSYVMQFIFDFTFL